MAGDSETFAVNPIRDTIFKGNEDAYYLVEAVATMGAGMGTQAISQNRPYYEANVGKPVTPPVTISGSAVGTQNGGTGNTEKNPLENIRYTDKVKQQMQQGDYHAFPESVDTFGSEGKMTQITGGDGIVRTKVEIPGSYGGKPGMFEYIIEPDGTTVNHRLFVPDR